jgi:hypothetical protein
VRLSVTEPDRKLPSTDIPLPLVAAHQDDPTNLKPAQFYTLRNHLEVVEDLSFLQGRRAPDGRGNRKMHRVFDQS